MEGTESSIGWSASTSRPFALAWNHGLCRAVLAVHARAVLGFYRRRARRGVSDGRSGAVTVIQRFGAASRRATRT